MPSGSGGRRARAREELRALFDEVAEIDWRAPAWRVGLEALATAEALSRRPLDPQRAVEAFTLALSASSGPVADTFMATHGPPAPADRAGRAALAARRAVSCARALAAQDHSAPGQRLVKVLRRGGGWLEDELLAPGPDVPLAFVDGDACWLARVRPDASPADEAALARALERGGEGLSRVERAARAPTEAVAAIALAPVSQAWARSFHRAAWSRGGGPWMGVADSPPYEVVSTCHAAVDGYAHARLCGEVLRASAGAPSPLAPDPFPGVAGIEPPHVGFASCVIDAPTPRFARALHAFGAVLDRHLGGGGARSVTFQVPIAPGQPTQAARWRRRPLYGLMALTRADGVLESPASLEARLPAFLAREASGQGLLTRTLLAITGVPAPRAVRRALLAGKRVDQWFGPARVLSGQGYLSWMRFPSGEEPGLPTFPSAIPSFSVAGRGGAGLSIAPFAGGLAVGLTTSGSLGTSARAEAFLAEWLEALPPAARGAARIA
ncbi:MAG: hypothetical protein KF729_37510 [Sandaracinaceae bacterium]|nr:hypothetical protein [Sandaracinaceae bacterium]